MKEERAALTLNQAPIRPLPCFKATVEWMHVYPAARGQILRHPGVRSFARSSAVGNHRAVVRNLIEMLLEFVGGNSNSVR